MAKKNPKRRIVRLISKSGATYYTTRRNDGEALIQLKYDQNTQQHEEFTEAKSNKNLGRNVVKKRK